MVANGKHHSLLPAPWEVRGTADDSMAFIGRYKKKKEIGEQRDATITKDE